MKSLLVVLLFVVAITATPNSIDFSEFKPLPLLRRPQARVTGGQEAKPKQFPYQVRLMAHYAEKERLACGGSLISAQYFLTAAHCADKATTISVILGAHNIKDVKEPGQIRMEATTTIVNSNWSSWVLNDDIALVKLPEPVQLNDQIQTIRLPRKSQANDTFLNLEATVSGWGLTGPSYSDVLMYTKNKIVDNSVCKRTVSNLMRRTNICLSGDRGTSACQGDHGDPLTIVDKDNKLTQIGLYSFGDEFGCGKGFGNVFTRITSYLDWIEENSDVNLS